MAVTFPLNLDQRRALEAWLCTGAIIRDSRMVDEADLVLVTPCSVQAMSRLRQQYRDATILVIDAELWSVQTSGGPVGRLLAAGADDYIVGTREKGAVSTSVAAPAA